MAGHSKWSNIQHRKGAQDKKRSKIFTKLIADISTAAREKGPDPDSNPRLRLAIEKAFKANMNKDNVKRAIEKSSGGSDHQAYLSCRYEGYGPGGAAVMVECLTDNRNRCVAQVRHAFSKAGGSIGTEGSVAYLFDHVGRISINAQGIDQEQLTEQLIDLGAQDMQIQNNQIHITCLPKDHTHICLVLADQSYEMLDDAITWIAKDPIELDDTSIEKLCSLLEKLDDLDDTQQVYHNINFRSDVTA